MVNGTVSNVPQQFNVALSFVTSRAMRELIGDFFRGRARCAFQDIHQALWDLLAGLHFGDEVA